jgi:CBS domain-containing protein
MGMRAKDMMETTVLTVDEDVDALSCARLMAERRKGYALLLRGGATISGIVTEWDFLEKLVATGRDPTGVHVREIASSAVHSCAPDAPADEVVDRMSKEGIRRVIVMSGGRAVGIITAKNVLAIFRPYIDQLSSEIAGYRSDPTPLG